MSYKLNSNVFFKKISDDQVNILLSDDDNSIFKLNKIAARVFLMLAEKNMAEEAIKKEVIALSNKSEQEIEAFLNDFFSKMVEQKFLVKA